jgi:hypothetical protein
LLYALRRAGAHHASRAIILAHFSRQLLYGDGLEEGLMRDADVVL